MGPLAPRCYGTETFKINKSSFTQPDGISITLTEEDIYDVEENFYFSSLFRYKTSHTLVLKCRKKSVLLALLILCGDIETHPGPQSLSRDQFQKFLIEKRYKVGSPKHQRT